MLWAVSVTRHPVGTRDRLTRAIRLRDPRSWRVLFHALTETDNDELWDFVLRGDGERYFDPALPWFAPHAADYLEEVVSDGVDSVLEWGSGASTVWLAQQGCRITSLETDEKWATLVRHHAGDAANVLLADRSSYFPSLTGYSMAIIDGSWRPDCIRHVLASDFRGVVVLDDSHRLEYREDSWSLGDAAVRSRHFAGTSPQLSPKMTSVFHLGQHRS
jgi:hypothetical protein